MTRPVFGGGLTQRKADLLYARSVSNYPEHLNRSRALMNAARDRTFRIACIGNSINFGCWSTNAAVSLADPALAEGPRLAGFNNRLRTSLNAAFGTTSPGEGVIINSDARVTSSGAQGVASLGITQSVGLRLHEAGDSATLTTLAGDTSTICDIHFTHGDHTNYGPFRYQINGGAIQSVTDNVTANPLTNTALYPMYTGVAANNFESVGTYRITGLTPGVNVIKVMPDAGGLLYFDLAGWSLWDRDPDNSSHGISISQISASGSYLSSVVTATSPPSSAQPRANMLTIGRALPDLMVFSFGANECSTTGQGLGHTPTNYRTILTDITNWCTNTYISPRYSKYPLTSLAVGNQYFYNASNPDVTAYNAGKVGCDVLLLSTGRRQPPVSIYGQEAFVDVHEDLAQANPRIDHLDLGDIWGDWTDANAAQRMFDEVHPGSLGHADVEKILLNYLLGTGRPI